MKDKQCGARQYAKANDTSYYCHHHRVSSCVQHNESISAPRAPQFSFFLFLFYFFFLYFYCFFLALVFCCSSPLSFNQNFVLRNYFVFQTVCVHTHPSTPSPHCVAGGTYVDWVRKKPARVRQQKEGARDSWIRVFLPKYVMRKLNYTDGGSLNWCFYECMPPVLPLFWADKPWQETCGWACRVITCLAKINWNASR